MNIAQVAKMTGYSVSALEKMRAAGKGPACMKAGRKYAYLRADVVAWQKTLRKGAV